ncbi:hypothetical protein E2542_SST05928 [Spatholobus suberectus]|nr:hypothetical protein E2542_SST05928 [Spatholobus suberectus]
MTKKRCFEEVEVEGSNWMAQATHAHFTLKLSTTLIVQQQCHRFSTPLKSLTSLFVSLVMRSMSEFAHPEDQSIQFLPREDRRRHCKGNREGLEGTEGHSEAHHAKPSGDDHNGSFHSDAHL